jgi:DNA-binding CsgD family transcriptional regulator
MSQEIELSEREREILRLVATGASNKEIALKLVISPNTVKVHLRNIFAKVGVASRTEATLYAMRSGLLPPPVYEPAQANLPPPQEPESLPATAEEIPPQPAVRTSPWRQWVFIASVVLIVLGGVGLAAWAFLRASQTPQKTPSPAVMRWSQMPPLPVPLQDAAGSVYQESIYLIGGEGNDGISGQVWQFNASTNTWTARAPKPTPVSQAEAAQLSEKIYVPGGQTADGKPSPVFEVYDPRQDRWEQRASLPTALSGYALATLEGKLYLFGGWDGASYQNRVYSYDPAEDTWSLRRAMPTHSAFAGAAGIGGGIMIAGGYDGTKALREVNLYFPTRDNPDENPWEARAPLPEGRYSMGMTALADQVYLLGGEGGQNLAPLEYHPQDDVWAAFESPTQAAGSHLLLLALKTNLHSLGGILPDGPTPEHLSYQAIYHVVFPVIQGGDNAP